MKIRAALKTAFTLVRRNIRSFLGFEVVYKLIATGLFSVILMGLFQLSMYVSGIDYLTASTLSQYLLNPIAILIIILILLGIVFVTLFDITAVINCLNASADNAKMTVWQMIQTGFKDSKRVFRPCNWSIIIFIIFIVPLTGVAAVSGYFSSLQIPGFILDYINANTLLSILFGVALLALVILAFSWCLSIHTFMFDCETYPAARHKSKQLMKGHYLKTLGGLLLMQLILFLIAMAAIVVIAAVACLIINFTVAEGMKLMVASIVVSVIALVVLVVLSFLSVPMSFSFLTAVYKDLHGEAEEEPVVANMPKNAHMPMVARVVAILAITVVVAVNIGLTIQAVTSYYSPEKSLLNYPQVAAHRGSSAAAPENSMPAYEQAITDGAEWVELDVHQTKDGVIVVTHDGDLKRIAGVDVNVYDLTYDEIERYDVGSWFSPEYSYLRVATLDEVIKQLQGRVKINIELKPTGHETNFEQGVIDVVNSNDFADDCVLASLDEDTVKTVKELDPSITTLYLMSVAAGDLSAIDYADQFSIEESSIDSDLVDSLHDQGKLIWAWTLNTEESVENMQNAGVDYVITDDPVMARNVIYSDHLNTGVAKILEVFFPYTTEASQDADAMSA